jgi:membrane-bound serine protease (ClpP class)
MVEKLRDYLSLPALAGVLLLLVGELLAQSVLAAEIRVVKLAATINPAVAEYLGEQIHSSNLAADNALIVELDTPGGLDTAMREMIQAILASEVPIVVYVAPAGARAASAGALITLAADIAAMAPGTNIGAAHPVSIGWQGGEEKGEPGVSMTKALNDAVAYARSLAEQRGRNPDWAEKAVRESVSAPASEALTAGVIDLLASDLDDLLQQLHGRSYQRAGAARQLQTQGARIIYSSMTWRQQILNILANPNVAYLLLMLGILGIFFEISQPGVILPGVLGTIALLLAFYALQMLPVNYSGVLLILLGMILFLLEVKVTSYGMLSVGGLVALLLGSLMLIRAGDPAMGISTGVIVATLALVGGFVVFVFYFVVRTQKSAFFSGAEAMAGEEGEVISAEGDLYRVFIRGEYWYAKSAQSLAINSRVRVVKLQPGMRLTVEPVSSEPAKEEPQTEGEK